MLEGWQQHRTGSSASLIAYFGFVSVFPLLAVLVTVLGWVLHDNAELQNRIVDSALGNIPIIGPQLADDPSKITGSVPVFVLGLATALWAGTRAFAQMQQAMDDIWEVPADDRPNIAVKRLRSLVAVAVIGSAQVLSATIITVGLSGVIDVAILSRIALTFAAFLVNLVTVTVVYRVLTSRSLDWRDVTPGAVVAAVAFTVLQYLGTALVGRAISNASDIYGTFATVIALIMWLSLHATATLLGVELNAALMDRRDRGGTSPSGIGRSTN